MDPIVTTEIPVPSALREPTDAEVLAAKYVLAQLDAEALQLAPEHPALLKASIEAAQRDGDRLLCARLLMRSAGVTRDPVYKAQLLRRAVLLIEELLAEPEGNTPPPTEPSRASHQE